MFETCALVIVWIVIIRLTRMVFLPLFIVLTLPGTLLHELLHFTVGLLLGARPVVISILPRRVPDGWELGRVGFANLNAVNSIPVCLAPLALAPFSYWAGVRWVAPVGHDAMGAVASTVLSSCKLYVCRMAVQSGLGPYVSRAVCPVNLCCRFGCAHILRPSAERNIVLGCVSLGCVSLGCVSLVYAE